MSDTILHVETIGKSFETVRALDDLSFQIEAGEIFALLGPNGAGKSTTVRILMGILRPDSGQIRYQIGSYLGPEPPSRTLGYLPEDRGLYPDVPILKTLVYMGILRGMPRAEATEATRHWLGRLGLLEREGEKLDALSKGNQQRVQFIGSILHSPSFAVLDEPFSGLDPINQEQILDILRDLRKAGTTILLSAHHLDLVERIADRVLLLDQGREVLAGTIDEVKKVTAARRLVFEIAGTPDTEIIESLPGVEAVEIRDSGEIATTLGRTVELNAFLNALTSRFEVTSIRSTEMDLHDIFVGKISERRAAAESAPGAKEAI